MAKPAGVKPLSTNPKEKADRAHRRESVIETEEEESQVPYLHDIEYPQFMQHVREHPKEVWDQVTILVKAYQAERADSLKLWNQCEDYRKDLDQDVIEYNLVKAQLDQYAEDLTKKDERIEELERQSVQPPASDHRSVQSEVDAKRIADTLKAMQTAGPKEPFDGTGDKVETFCTRVRRLFKTFSHASDDIQLLYLQGKVTNNVTIYLEDRFKEDSPNQWTNGEEVLLYLESVFGIANKKVEARKEFKKLYQKDKAKVIGYSDEMMREELLDRVNNDIKTALAARDIPDDVHLLAKDCMTISERLSTIYKPRTAAANSSASNAKKQTNSPDNRQSSSTPPPAAGNRRPLTGRYATEEYNSDREGNLCYRCHRPGHKVSDCPEQAWNKGKAIAAVELSSDQDGEGKDQPPT